MDLTAFYSQFRDETAENLRVLGDGLLLLEREPGNREQLDTVFRAMHTIKGSARMLGLTQIGTLAHAMEHLLGVVREGRRPLTPALSTKLLHAGDALLELTSAAVEGRATAVNLDTLLQALETTPASSARDAGPPLESRPAALAASADRSLHDAPPAGALPTALAAGAETSLDGARPPGASPTAPTAVARIPASQASGEPILAPAQSAAQHTSAVSGGGAATGSGRRQTVRVRVDRLDRLLNLAGELAVGRQMQWSHLQALGELDNLADQQQRALLALDHELRQLRFSQREQDRLQGHLDEIASLFAHTCDLVKQQVTHFNGLTRRHDLLVDDLEQEVMTARLVAVAAAFANLPRAARDLCQATGKEIDLVLSGEETEIDRKVLELLGDPLTHLLRNAVDHGIEPPQEREQLGKPRRGRICIAAEMSGGNVQIAISDDGRGMDAQRLRDSALGKGLIGADEAALLSDQEALELVFMPGFSTAQLITDISGRGVGLDIVRTNISELGGQVQVTSTPGQGTMIRLLLPLTLVTTRVLLLDLAHQIYALPAAASRGVTWLRPEMLHSIEGQLVAEHGGQTLALIQLEQLLGGESRPLEQNLRRPAVLIGTAQRPVALIVDRIIDEREVVVKPLGPLFERYRHYGGVTQLGDGRLALLLNPGGLVALARGAAPTSLAPHLKRRRRLLYAEDSFSTRELVRSILTSAGYDVTVAVDGQDALELLRSERFDMLVSDVEMPRLNGFQLTNSVRKDLQIAEMPVIMMTSLASDEHRRQGLEVGAQAYIVKGQFDQNNLLETIRQLLGT